MPDIIVAADETAATKLVHDAETALVIPPVSGSGNLGPFHASWAASVSFSGGTIDLIPPSIIRIKDCQFHYKLSFGLSINLNSFLPHFCLPQVCVHLPFIGRVCTPRICISWPTVSLPTITYADALKFTADFMLQVSSSGANWDVDIVIVGIPSLELSATAAAILVLIGSTVAAAVVWVPFIGPFIAGLVLAVTAAIGIAGVTGLLGPILTPFVSGLKFNVYSQPKVFPVLPAGGAIDPAVNVNLDLITASVQGSDKDELVLTADISP
jgi:hypothetical protein